MAYEYILTDKSDGCGTITLNRPKANALSLELVSEIGCAVQGYIEDAEVRCILITGGEGKFFSGGADIPSLGSSLAAPFAEGMPLPAGLKTVDIIETSPKPVIAAVNGIAVGGGCELTLACHFRLAADTALFGQPEINLGIVPGWGGCHRLPRLIGDARALDWMLTGRMVSAQEAFEAGLVVKVVPLSELSKAARDLAGVLASKPAVATRAILRAVRERAFQPECGKALEAEAFAEAAASRDAREGIAAFLEKRPPNFTGA